MKAKTKSPVGYSFDPGKKIYGWCAYDYHPHTRGVLWYIGFGGVIFGTAIWSWFSDDAWGWLTSFSLFVAAAVYLWTHRQGPQEHSVTLYQRGLMIDERDYFPWEKIVGFWLLCDEYIGVVKFVQRTGWGEKELTLQLGDANREKLLKRLEYLEIPELEDRSESLVDLWLRVFKL